MLVGAAACTWVSRTDSLSLGGAEAVGTGGSTLQHLDCPGETERHGSGWWSARFLTGRKGEVFLAERWKDSPGMKPLAGFMPGLLCGLRARTL